MATSIRRRRGTAEAPSADEYSAPPTERRPRRGREAPAEDLEPKYSREDLASASDDQIVEWADQEDIDPSIDDLDEVAKLLAKVTAPADPPEEPARRRRGRPEPEPEEEPARRSRRRSEPEEDPDEAPPARRRRGRDDEAEEAPTGRRARRDTSSRDDDDDDSEPIGERAEKRGWGAFNKENAKHFDRNWKPLEEESLVKFLEDEPFDVYGLHQYFDEIKQGPRTAMCISEKQKCPLDGLGDKPTTISLFNIAIIDLDTGEPELQVLECGPKLTKLLERKGRATTGPLSKQYYSITLVKPSKGPIDYSVDLVKERDVKEDFGVDPLSRDELDDFRDKMREDPTPFTSMKVIRAIADKLMND